jgi:CBS domain containing-hemolysin-like protein
MGNSVLYIALALLLVLLNGFFVAAEFGLVKLRQTRVKAIAKTYGWRGRNLARVHRNLDAYLSACQLGITLASLGLGWVGEPAVAHLLEPLLIWLLNHSSNWILRVMGLDDGHGHESHYSAEELKLILRSSRADEKSTSDEWRVLAHALDFRDLEVADLMRPFQDAATLSRNDDLQTSLERVVNYRYTRYPYLDAEGHVVGVIHLKDVFIATRSGEPLPNLDALVRPVLTVSPTLSATELFRRFREGNPHFAVVAYDGQPPIGFITLDNLLGALVGEIRDEFRRTRNEWTKLDDGSLIGKGSLPIVTVERALGIDIDEDEFDSIGGLILQTLGDLPNEGQRVEFEHFDVVVRKMLGPRIVLVHIFPKAEVEPDE